MSKNVKNSGEMSQIHSILMLFTELTMSHSILHQNSCSWACFKGHGYVNCQLCPYLLEPLPTTCVGMLYLCISLLICTFSSLIKHRYSTTSSHIHIFPRIHDATHFFWLNIISVDSFSNFCVRKA